MAKVQDTIVYRILQENPRNFETYIGYVLDFVQAETITEE